MKATSDKALCRIIRRRYRDAKASRSDGDPAPLLLLPPEIIRFRPKAGSTRVKFEGYTIIAGMLSQGTMKVGWNRELKAI